jgi:hypothetical protein
MVPVQMNAGMKKRIVALGAAALMGIFAGCAADDIEFNGGLFNAVGLGGQQTKSEDPKLAARAPIVIPPNLERVPPPGEQPGEASSEVAALNDPDKLAAQSEEEKARQQAEYCKVNYEQAKARGDQDADLAEGPLGPCRGSVVNVVKKMNSSEQ